MRSRRGVEHRRQLSHDDDWGYYSGFNDDGGTDDRGTDDEGTQEGCVVVEMEDSFGDGWNGAYYTITDRARSWQRARWLEFRNGSGVRPGCGMPP